VADVDDGAQEVALVMEMRSVAGPPKPLPTCLIGWCGDPAPELRTATQAHVWGELARTRAHAPSAAPPAVGGSFHRCRLDPRCPVVLGNSIYEHSGTALPDFPIQHTLPARDGGSGDSRCPASTIISGRRRDPTSAEETLLSPKQCAEICGGPRRRNGPSRNPSQRVCYCDSTRHPCTVQAARRSCR